MHPVGTQILLVGATTPVGRELLLRLAIVGFEVVAYMPHGDDGRTGEFACRLVHDTDEVAAASAAGAVVVRVESDAIDGPSVVVGPADASRRFRHPPTISASIDRVRGNDWRAWLRDPWAGHALPVVNERDVAATVADALVHDRPSAAFGGPQALTWHAIVAAVHAADARPRAWRPWVGRWPSPEYAVAALTTMARFPRIGRRSLADALTRRESAAHDLVRETATSDTHTQRP